MDNQPKIYTLWLSAICFRPSCEPIREQRFDWWHGFRFCNWKTPWGAEYISFDHIHNMPISNYSNNMRKQQKSIRYKCRNYSQHETCFFFLVLFGYLRLSFFGLSKMCENRTGEIRYYVNDINLERKEVANTVHVLCPEQANNSELQRLKTDSSDPLSTYINIDGICVLKFSMSFSFILHAVKANQKLVGEQLENGFHMHSFMFSETRLGQEDISRNINGRAYVMVHLQGGFKQVSTCSIQVCRGTNGDQCLEHYRS